jgi:hypothetical protein
MIAVDFPEENITFTKPADMTDEECGSLPAYSDGTQVVSCWELTPEDLQRINETCRIWLGVCMPIPPPVWLTTENPFKT